MKTRVNGRICFVGRLMAVLIGLGLLVSGPWSQPSSGGTAPPPVLQQRPEASGPPSEGRPEGTVIIEGDIIVPIDFFRSHAPGAVWDSALWPDGVVPYEFDTNVTTINQQQMLLAMGEWESVAHVDFRPRSGDDDYLHIRDSSTDSEPENSSYVGRQGGEQIINIVSWGHRFIMAHELGHALGLWHEQSRSDRDFYVHIEWDCIESGYEHNFEKHDSADVYPKRAYSLADDETYDFDSVMHYPDTAFLDTTVQGCTQTITVLPPNQAWQNLIGQRTHLSDLDALTMSFLYPESGWYFLDGTDTDSEQDGTFVEPYTTFGSAMASVPSGSILWIQPGTYPAAGTYSKPVTLRAPLGETALGQ